MNSFILRHKIILKMLSRITNLSSLKTELSLLTYVMNICLDVLINLLFNLFNFAITIIDFNLCVRVNSLVDKSSA